MHIENDMIPRPKRSLFYARETPGKVLKTCDDTKNQNTVGVYIPRLMFAIDCTNGPQESVSTLNTSCIANKGNKNIGSSSVKLTNYVTLPFFIIPNVAVPKFKKGENVIVGFADEDIKSMMVMPYKMNEMVNRKTDQASWYIPAKKNEKDEVSLKNVYALQMDSEDMLMTLVMNNDQGEKSRYFLTFDGKNGEAYFSDDNKRFVKFTTKTDTILIQNESKTKISMEKRKIDVECDDFSINAKNSFKVKTSSYSIEADSMKEKASSLDSKIDTRTEKGNSYTINYTKLKKEGTSEEAKYSKVGYTTPIFGISGVCATGGLGFKAPTPGEMPPGTAAKVDETGMANFGTPNAMGLPLAVSMYTSMALMTVAGIVDSLCGINHIPPTCTAAMAAMSPLLASKRVSG